MAGQGVNLGFGDVVALTQILSEAVSNGCLLNNMQYLCKYQTQRQRHNVPTMLVIDALHRLYKGTAAPVVLARSLGLQLTNAVPQIKVNLKRNLKRLIFELNIIEKKNKYRTYLFLL